MDNRRCRDENRVRLVLEGMDNSNFNNVRYHTRAMMLKCRGYDRIVDHLDDDDEGYPSNKVYTN